MSDAHDGLIARLEETLTCQRYSRVVVHNYCRHARDFLSYLSERSIALEAVTPTQVSQYLRCAVRHFRERRGRPPASAGHPFHEPEFTRYCGSSTDPGRLSPTRSIPARAPAGRYAARMRRG